MEVIMHHREEVVEEEPQLVERRRMKRPAEKMATTRDVTSSSSNESSDSETNGSDSKAMMNGFENNQESGKNGILGKSVYFDNNEGTNHPLSLSDNNLRVEDVVNSIINNQDNIIGNLKDQIMSDLNDPTLKQKSRQEDDIGASGVANEDLRINLVEDSDEEVIELEFERAVHKLHTHTSYCLNCSSRITKVILRRRKRERRGLLGCLSCFSIFIPSGNCLQTLGIFGSKSKPEIPPIVQEKPMLEIGCK